MNNEQLTAYLKDESYLYSLSFEELKTLVVQYPYATNLRVLLLKKSFIEQNKDYDRNLQMAAAYSTNRRFLYNMVKKLKTLQNVPENVILGEDYLELTELSNIERILNERHVTEVYTDRPRMPDMGLQLDWGSADFQDSAGSKTDEDNLPFDIPFIPDILLPVVEPKQVATVQEDIQELDVNQAIDNIMLEFDSQALDLTGWQNNSSTEHLTVLDTLSESVFFVNDDLSDEIIENSETILTLDEPENRHFIEHEQTSESLFTEEDYDMKKSDVEIEIVNQNKTVIVEKSVEESLGQPKLSFSEWLRQFKMIPEQDLSKQKHVVEQLKPIEILDSLQTVSRPQTVPSVDHKQVLDKKIVALMFEQPNQLPDNLFNLNDSTESVSLEGFFADNTLDKMGDELPKKKKKKKNMHELAVKSIEENDDLISETLADLLAFQGNNNKAIEMYMRLGLQVPEKSDYFAAKIEILRNMG
jgi:hypothetical protein